MARKVTIEHRQIQLPPRSLRSPKLTNAKMTSEGCCRMCQRPSTVRPLYEHQLTRHHIIPVSWWIRQPVQLRVYRNAWAGIVPLCREDHDRVHSKDVFERLEARRMLRRSMTQQEIAFVISVRGKEWLDGQYPR